MFGETESAVTELFAHLRFSFDPDLDGDHYDLNRCRLSRRPYSADCANRFPSVPGGSSTFGLNFGLAM